MGIVGAITGQNSMQTQAASQQQSLQALEMQARQMLSSGQIPPLNLQGARPEQLQGVLDGITSQAQMAGPGSAIDALSRYRTQELLSYAQHLGVQLFIPQNLSTPQAPSPSIGGYPQMGGGYPAQQQAPQQSYNQPTAGYEEYQLGMGIPGYGLDVGGQHFDYGSMTPERTYQLMQASGGQPQQPSAPQMSYTPQPQMGGYGASPQMSGYPGMAQGYGASPYASNPMAGYGGISASPQMGGYGASPYGNTAMGGYGSSMQGINPYGQVGMSPAGQTGGSNIAGINNPQGGFAILSALGGSTGTGMTSDAIRDLGTTIATSGRAGGSSLGALGGLGFLGGGGSGGTSGLGSSPTGMNALGGFGGSPTGISGFGNAMNIGSSFGGTTMPGMNGFGGF